MMSLRLITVGLLVAAAQGFLLAPLVARTPPVRFVAPIMGYEEVAAECLEEGCSVDTVHDLLTELKATRNPSTDIIETINKLESLLLKPEANKNEIEKIVASAARSFSTVDSFEFKGEPLGYTGKAGTTTTAGKALE